MFCCGQSRFAQVCSYSGSTQKEEPGRAHGRALPADFERDSSFLSRREPWNLLEAACTFEPSVGALLVVARRITPGWLAAHGFGWRRTGGWLSQGMRWGLSKQSASRETMFELQLKRSPSPCGSESEVDEAICGYLNLNVVDCFRRSKISGQPESVTLNSPSQNRAMLVRPFRTPSFEGKQTVCGWKATVGKESLMMN